MNLCCIYSDGGYLVEEELEFLCFWRIETTRAGVFEQHKYFAVVKIISRWKHSPNKINHLLIKPVNLSAEEDIWMQDQEITKLLLKFISTQKFYNFMRLMTTDWDLSQTTKLSLNKSFKMSEIRTDLK